MRNVPMEKDCLLNDKGFTLIEMLVSLSIICMIVSFYPMIFQFLKGVNHIPPYEIDVFFHQIGKEILEAKDIEVIGSTLAMQLQNGSYVTYEPYNTIIRRRVNGSGHEVLLMDVRAVQYKKYNNGIHIIIEGLDGDLVKRMLPQAPLPWVSSNEVSI